MKGGKNDIGEGEGDGGPLSSASPAIYVLLTMREGSPE